MVTVLPSHRPHPGLRHLPKPLLVPGSRNLPAPGRASAPPAQPQPGAAGRFPEGQGAGPWHPDGLTDGPRPSPAGPDACLPTPAAGPPRSRAPSPPRRLLRTFRASLGRPRGSARGPRLRLGCATAPEPPRTRHCSRRLQARLGPRPCELALRRRAKRVGATGTLSGRGPGRSAPSPLVPQPRRLHAARPRPLDRVPGTPADLPLARRLPLSWLRLRLRLRLQPRCSWAPPAGCSETHSVPAPPRSAGKTRP